MGGAGFGRSSAAACSAAADDRVLVDDQTCLRGDNVVLRART